MSIQSRRLGVVALYSFAFLSALLALIWAGQSAIALNQGENPHLLTARAGHTATALKDGSIVIAGGSSQKGYASGIEVYDVATTKSWAGPRMITPRAGHTATLLADGSVLLVGGRNATGALDSTELYNPATGAVSKGATLNQARTGHTATPLADGRVLIAGGNDSGVAELFDPKANAFYTVDKLTVARSGHSAIRLATGQILLVGGYGEAAATAEIFDPVSMRFSAVAGGLKAARVQPTLNLLPDGKVQVFGGDSEMTMEVFSTKGYFSSRGHLLRDSSAFWNVLHSPASAALVSMPTRNKSAAREVLGDSANVFERTGHSATRSSAKMIVAGGFDRSGGALETINSFESCGATVTTDLTDYHPGQTVIMSGAGWLPGEAITLNLHRDTDNPPDTVLYATADENGNWTNAEYVVQEYDLYVTFVLTATGDSGCNAQTTFTDAPSPDVLHVRSSAGTSVTLSYILNGTGNCLTGGGTVQTTTLTPSTGLDDSNFGGSVKYRLTVPATLATPNSPVGAVFDHWLLPDATTDTANPICANGNNGGATDRTYTAVYVASSVATTTTVASSLNPSTSGASVTFTATVLAGVTPVTTGSVSFYDGGTCAAPGTSLGAAVPLNGSGQAPLSTSALTVGSHTINACYGGASGFNTSGGSVTQVVNAATTTTLGSSLNPSTWGASVTFTATVLKGVTPVTVGSVSFYDGGTCVAPGTSLGAAVPLNGSGQAAISASTLSVATHTILACYSGSPGAPNFVNASNGSVSQVVNKATSTTTLTCPASQPYTGSAIEPCTATYSTSDGLSGSATVTYSNNINVGTATANASYAGDSNHDSSSDSKTFEITKATSTTTLTCPASQPYTGSAIEPCTATYSTTDGLSGSVTVTYSNNINVGTATANATYPGDANHETSSDSKTFEITKATSTTTITCPASEQYTGSAITPCTASYSTSDGLSGSVTVTYSNNINVGTATANATYPGDSNHETSSDSKTFEITKATSTTTITCPASEQYTGSAITPCTASYSTSDGLSGSVTVTYSNNINVGTATANASYAGDANHQGSSDSKTFEITKATSTTTVTCPASEQYTGSAITPCTASYSTSDGLSGGLTVSYTNNINVGTATADATYPGDSNHEGSSDSKTFEITKATSTTTVTCPASEQYSGSAITPCTASYSTSDGLSGGLTVSYTNNINVGTASADAAYPGDANHEGSSDSKTFEITKATSTTTLTCPASQQYTGSAITPCTASYSTSDGLSGGLTVTYGNNTNVGTATADAAYPGDSNHEGSSDSKTFEITKATSTTTVTCPASQAYTGSAITPCTASYSTSDGLSGGLTVSYGNNINVGTATADAAYPGDANHEGSSDSKTFEITKATSTTTVTCPASQQYTGSAITPCTASYSTSDGLSGGLTVSYSNNINVGTASASASYPGDSNHQGSSDSKTFEITKATSVTTVVCPVSKVYTSAAITPCTASYSTSDGLSGGLTVGYLNNVNVGTATANASYLGDSNHQGSSDSKTFQITKATPTVSATGGNFVFDNNPHPGTCTVTGVGTDGSLGPLAPTYTPNPSPAAAPTASGTYTVNCNYPGSANYLPGSATASIFIDTRDALVNYIGQQVFVTSGSSATTAQVTLSASVQDPTGLALVGATMTFIDITNGSPGKVLAANVPVAPVQNQPDATGTANKIVTLSTGQYGAESYLIRVVMTGNYDNTLQPTDDKTATVVVAKPADTNETMGGGEFAGLASSAGMYKGAVGEKGSYTIALKYNKSGANLQGKITVSVKQPDGSIVYIKSNSISSMAVVKGTPKTSTIYTKSSMVRIMPDGSSVTLDGGVTLRLDAEDGTTDKVGITVLSSKDSTLYYSNQWLLQANVWKTVNEAVNAGGFVTIN